MRQKIIAGNWKMNKNLMETKDLISDLKKETKRSGARVIVFPSFVNLCAVVELVEGTEIQVGAQTVSQYDSGAFTGEVSGGMLLSIGVKTVMIGHSERRVLFGESTKLVARKVLASIEDGLEIVFCCGEKLKHRKTGLHFDRIEYQLREGLFHISEEKVKGVIIAYEPVWAIGTGETATPEQAQEMHAFIRSLFEKRYSKEVADSISILYGGSCNPANAKDIFSMPDVDGGLIGGASLKAKDFFEVVNAI